MINTYPAGGFDLTFGPLEHMKRPTPGPLMMSALAIFGESSMFSIAAKSSDQSNPPITTQICQADNMPFQRVVFGPSVDRLVAMNDACSNLNNDKATNATRNESAIGEMLYQIAAMFDPANFYGDYADLYLSIAVFLATRAWLTQTTGAGNMQYNREIFSSPGLTLIRPEMSIAATVVISLLITLQVLGLVALVFYIYSVPTWTAALDSRAVAQLTKDVDDEAIPAIGETAPDSLKRLTEIDGLVGVVSIKGVPQDNNADDDDTDSGAAKQSTGRIKLQRGGQEVVSRALLHRRSIAEESLLEK